MKTVMYAEKSNTKIKLIEKIMEGGDRLRNDGGVGMKAINSLTEKAQRCLDNHGDT